MKKKFILLVALIASGSLLGLTSFALAGTISLINPLGSVNSFTALIVIITTFINGIIASLAVLMFVIAGIFFVTSAGNPEKIGRAKKIAIYAVIGSAIALAGGGLITVIKTIIGVS
ncbi:MAG: hypothetical protein A3C58_00240 [Candidatus Staskawiczbacteria bacterium RIFCSPHIGHO2_02_FULL_34_10]|uniref:Uncharacterized protein n=2 Tax=Candidatus Staskawicziibacteriota TaxID=1817916 RepID=A0A1G2HLA0_9BACT|nr:MAG: hypothetical protein A2639_02410 [Candidatus Staskawiczbacteria bacterium RIFCSPHIGHO2_01_FULL_34_27]OGZ67208.1 MAG: hypothetical protein A3C58_00240 [Candidatus Staskawiczbacteria bacterium RIFCSPHIGHO2_02_FULL_34_10]